MAQQTAAKQVRAAKRRSVRNRIIRIRFLLFLFNNNYGSSPLDILAWGYQTLFYYAIGSSARCRHGTCQGIDSQEDVSLCYCRPGWYNKYGFAA